MLRSQWDFIHKGNGAQLGKNATILKSFEQKEGKEKSRGSGR